MSGVQAASTGKSSAPAAETERPVPQYHPPRPRAAFSLFVDFPKCFIQFLEAMMGDATREQGDIDDISTTLFEVYLYESRKGGKEERGLWEEKAKALLADQKVGPPGEWS